MINTSELVRKYYGEMTEECDKYFSGIVTYNYVHSAGKGITLQVMRQIVKEEGWLDVNMWDYNRRLDRDKRQSRRLSNFDGSVFL